MHDHTWRWTKHRWKHWPESTARTKHLGVIGAVLPSSIQNLDLKKSFFITWTRSYALYENGVVCEARHPFQQHGHERLFTQSIKILVDFRKRKRRFISPPLSHDKQVSRVSEARRPDSAKIPVGDLDVGRLIPPL